MGKAVPLVPLAATRENGDHNGWSGEARGRTRGTVREREWWEPERGERGWWEPECGKTGTIMVASGALPNGLALQSNTWSDVLKRVLDSQNHGPIAAKPGASRLLII